MSGGGGGSGLGIFLKKKVEGTLIRDQRAVTFMLNYY